jgi:chaperonin GroES
MKYNWIKPALGRVCLQPLPAEERTESGIWLVNNKEQVGQACRVVEVCEPYGAGSDDQDSVPEGPIWKVGQAVLIGKYNGVDVELGREKFILLRESDVIGELQEKKET